MTLNLYTYVHNNPLTGWDPSGHEREGWNVIANLTNARNYGSGSDLYWQVRSSLGSDFKNFYPGAKEDDNNYFKYLFNMATMTSSNPEDNTEGNAGWAAARMAAFFQADYESNQAYMDGLVAFVTGGLDIPLKARAAKTAATTEELFLPEAAYGKQLPKFVEPGTKALYKYDDAGELIQTKYYDDYGRETGWVDWTNHNRPYEHTTPHYHGVEWNAEYPVHGYKTDFRIFSGGR